MKTKIMVLAGGFFLLTLNANAFWWVFPSNQNNQIQGTSGNDILHGSLSNNNVFISNGGSDIITGGFSHDKVILNKRPIDYTYKNFLGKLYITDVATKNISKLHSIENIEFKGNNKSYSTDALLSNPLLVSRRDIQLFGDTENNRLVGMQMSTMKQVFDIPLNGELIYSVDMVSRDKSYGYGRDSHKLFVLTRGAEGVISNTKTISLPFAPRTGANNTKLGLTLITGADKPMFALIDTKTDRIVASGGRDEFTRFDDSNHGSHWATGHGIWLTDRHFVYSDREARELITYRINPRTLRVKEIGRIKTDSSVHTVIGKLNNNQKTYYAVTEGSNDSKPALIELVLEKSMLTKGRKVELIGDDPTIMTSHHADESPEGRYIYMGSSEGTLNIIDKFQMRVIRTIKAGKGVGHTTFIPQRGLALVTNHKDTFVTAINIYTLTKIKDIEVSGPQINNTALQSHTSRMSLDNRYYYNFATDNGYYFRIDLNTLTVDQRTYTGGTPKQASQPGEVNLIFK